MVRGRIRRRRSRRAAVRVWCAHWSRCCLGLAAIEAHANRWAHHLSFWRPPIIVAAAAATPTTAIRTMGRRLLGVSSPLLGWGAGGRARSRICLAVGRLRSRLVWWLTTVGRLLLVDLRGIVWVVILGGQRSVRCVLRGMMLAVFGVPRLLLRLGVAGLSRGAGVGCRTLGSVGGLLAIAVAWVWLMWLMRLVRLVRLVWLMVATAI